MRQLSLVVLISGSGSNLAAILDAIEAGKIPGATVKAVISNRPNAYGLERAKDKNIPAFCVDHTQFDSREAFDTTLLQQIEQHQPDVVILAGFMRILTPTFVQALNGKLLNVHPSLLPKYQGLNTHQRAIDSGDKEHGCSIHYVTEELDGGPVITQAIVDIDSTDTAETLAKKVQIQEHKLFPLCINWFVQNRLAMIKNQATFDGEPLGPQGQRLNVDELNKQLG